MTEAGVEVLKKSYFFFNPSIVAAVPEDAGKELYSQSRQRRSVSILILHQGSWSREREQLVLMGTNGRQEVQREGFWSPITTQFCSPWASSPLVPCTPIPPPPCCADTWGRQSSSVWEYSSNTQSISQKNHFHTTYPNTPEKLHKS